MLFYQEPAKEIPVAAQVDVLVLGAGPAGVAAAVSAARQDTSVMLVEQGGDVGGIATAGLMSHWTGNTRGGIYEEILDRSFDSIEKREIPGLKGSLRQVINPEKLKTVFLEMLAEVGVKLRLYTFACDAIMDGERVTGVIVESKSGREAVFAKVVIDCTGDGDIAARAGVEYRKGRETDGAMQPATIMFKVAGVDYSRAVFPGGFEDTIDIPKGEIQSLGAEHLPFPAGHVLLYRTTLPGIVTCNMTNCIGVDGTNTDDLVKATYTCRGQMQPIVDFLREYVPGYEKCYIISSSALIGVRETRHFKGVKTLTKEDIEQARVFDDWVVTNASFNFDVHNMTGNGLDVTGAQKKFTQSKGYTIPYGCLVPEKIDGLLLAGRDISGTHMAHSNYRVMPICANMGQAAGIAAALSAKKGIRPRDLDIGEIQGNLMESGVSL